MAINHRRWRRGVAFALACALSGCVTRMSADRPEPRRELAVPRDRSGAIVGDPATEAERCKLFGCEP